MIKIKESSYLKILKFKYFIWLKIVEKTSSTKFLVAGTYFSM